jgi:hypothetical protein
MFLIANWSQYISHLVFALLASKYLINLLFPDICNYLFTPKETHASHKHKETYDRGSKLYVQFSIM